MPLCFAIMPITIPPNVLERYGGDPLHFTKVAKHIFKPAAEAADFTFKAPASTSAEVIQAEIIDNLQNADLVLCDVSTLNANVFFELGIRVALNKPVAMVRDNRTATIPFDNSIVNTHTYMASLQIDTVEEQVPLLTRFIKTAATQDQNALWKYFGITQRARQIDVGSPEDAKLEIITRQIESLRSDLSIIRGGASPNISEIIAPSSEGVHVFYASLPADLDRLRLDPLTKALDAVCNTFGIEVLHLSLDGNTASAWSGSEEELPRQAFPKVAATIFVKLANVNRVSFGDISGKEVRTVKRSDRA